MKRIIVVDDNKQNRYLLQKLLEGNNYIVETAADGVEALEIARKRLPDMVITDVLMPNMDGFQLCRELKIDEELKDVLVVFYSATYTDKKSRKFAMDIGAAEYILKPQEPDVFIQIVNNIWDKYSKEEIKSIEKPIEEEVYMKMYNGRLVWKLEKKMLDLEKSENHIKYLYSVLESIRGVNRLIVKEKNRDVILQKACDNLTKARGYDYVWLGILKDKTNFDIVVGSPNNEDVSGLSNRMLKADYPACIERAFIQKVPLMVIERSKDCGECLFKNTCHGSESVIVRITYMDELFGFLILVLAPDISIDDEEESLLKEIAGDIAFGLHDIEMEEKLGKQTKDLKKMVRELRCLDGISNLIENIDASLEQIIQGSVNLLPFAWEYPESICARIILETKEFKTENFKETICMQSSDIMAYNKPIGNVEVYSLEERPEKCKKLFLKEERKFLNTITKRLGEIIEKKQAEIEMKQTYQKLQETMEGTINAVCNIAEVKDPYTAGHQRRVAQLAVRIARKMKLSKNKIEGIRIASLVHDIGKISVPAEILNKPIKLSEIEYSLIKIHTQTGYDILKHIEFPWPIADIVLQHHEKLNGSGYPNELKYDEILIEAKIIGIADVVEAMSSHRPYRPALGKNVALEEITQGKGIFYDPDIVDVCLEIFKENEFEFKY